MKAIQQRMGARRGLSQGTGPPSLGTLWNICVTRQCDLMWVKDPEHLKGCQWAWQSGSIWSCQEAYVFKSTLRGDSRERGGRP